MRTFRFNIQAMNHLISPAEKGMFAKRVPRLKFSAVINSPRKKAAVRGSFNLCSF